MQDIVKIIRKSKLSELERSARGGGKQIRITAWEKLVAMRGTILWMMDHGHMVGGELRSTLKIDSLICARFYFKHHMT